MPVRMSPQQFAACDAIAVEDFYRELHDDMVAAFPEMEEERIRQYNALCRTTCARLGVETEQAIYCFHILTLHQDRLLSETEGYADRHSLYVRKYGSGDQLPIDLHAWLTVCVA
jgi:hypothetical protein